MPFTLCSAISTLDNFLINGVFQDMTFVAPPLTVVVVLLGDEVAAESVLEEALGLLVDHDLFFGSSSFKMCCLDSNAFARFMA